ncbi:adenylyl-sulfate kinase [Aureimonas sp. SA4125]|uniref:adenylyl-sulfate kinase n=1 Tax=Aureimonas sp. SA4125 TaxID=2826993 RepID=UPI001CC6358E|nr:adenylyl-sulfate kinase [Aureimonas sp. SA4125]BDA83910.1 adenylyl-sulfate kinase [Aureimonas sp. SA4125]
MPGDRTPELPTLHLLTCGSVDDGKSTLIGRLLFEQHSILDDQLQALRDLSRKQGAADVDFALLVDGLEAEMEQGITIDVAYRHFATPGRSFLVADTPGHEQYTRNMATAASNCDLAILLVNAKKGLLTQTRRHAYIASLLGVRHFVLAVNKIDLVDYREAEFREISDAFKAYADILGLDSFTAIPLSASLGDNVSTPSEKLAWYRGPTLIEHLEQVAVDNPRLARPLRLPIQLVTRVDADQRFYAGTIETGVLAAGQEVVVACSGRRTTIARIVSSDGDKTSAEAGDAVMIALADNVDLARGDLLVAPRDRPVVADQFAAHVVWMSDIRLLPGRSYLMKIGTRTLPVTVSELKHRVEIDGLTHIAAKTLGLNEIGYCNLSVSMQIAFDAFCDNPGTGSFVLIDRRTNATLGAGIIDFALRRATNVHHQELTVTKTARAALKHQRPAVIWFTGLSGAGKSTIANIVEIKLHSRGLHTTLLDGDNVRHGLNKNLGFTDVDRIENIRRVGEVAKLMVDAGLIVLCSFISPFQAERDIVRSLVDSSEFLEVFVDAPLETCIARDPKGLYKRALAGELRNFTGIDQAYERPSNPEIALMAGGSTPDRLADEVIRTLEERGIVSAW